MSGKRLYLDPPHLLVSFYPETSESLVFLSVCEVAERKGCVPSGIVEISSRDTRFELLSDLGAEKVQKDISSAHQSEFIKTAVDGGRRVVRSGYVHNVFGKVVIEYQPAPLSEMHPICLSVSAGALGIPDDLRDSADRREARDMGRWARELLEGVGRTGAVGYGMIDLEVPLPTPSQIKEASQDLPTEAFISRNLLDRRPAMRSELAHLFRPSEIFEFDFGMITQGWLSGGSHSRQSQIVESKARGVSRILGGVL